MILYQVTHQKDISNLKEIIPTLEFKESELGLEIPEFNVTNPMQQEILEYLPNYQFKDNSGFFRKPYPFIHFESFTNINDWVAVYCIEEFTFRIHSQPEINYVFDINDNIESFIKDNCFDASKWNIDTEIKLKTGQILFFRPWLFHSLDGGIGHYFFMEITNGI